MKTPFKVGQYRTLIATGELVQITELARDSLVAFRYVDREPLRSACKRKELSLMEIDMNTPQTIGLPILIAHDEITFEADTFNDDLFECDFCGLLMEYPCESAEESFECEHGE